jgi:hypothetical protein
MTDMMICHGKNQVELTPERRATFYTMADRDAPPLLPKEVLPFVTGIRIQMHEPSLLSAK